MLPENNQLQRTGAAIMAPAAELGVLRTEADPMTTGHAGATPDRFPHGRSPQGYLRADSLKLSILNIAAASAARVLDVSGAYQGELLGVGVPLFLAPTLALMAVAFMRRDLRHGWTSAVTGATVLTLVALATSWWPLLQAD